MIKENNMIHDGDFVLGTDYVSRNSSLLHLYNPDKVNNFHVSISGASGSGKTRMLKHLVKYLAFDKNKHIHIIDVKGDLNIDGENYIDFPIRNQLYGINPFEFDRDTSTGGVKRRAGEIVEMIVKSFELKIGAAKKDIINRLVIDTYGLKGICEDENTWGIGLSKQEQAQMLPSVEDLRTLTNTILDAVNYGQSDKLDAAMKKGAKKALKSSAKAQKIRHIFIIKKKELRERYREEALIISLEENADIEEVLLNFYRDDPEYHKLNQLENDIQIEESSIEAERDNFLEVASHMFDNYLNSNGKDKNSSFDSFVTEDSTLNNVDLKYYSKNSVTAMLESVLVYFEMLCNSGLFNKNIPPVKAGLNRYDISKHNQQTQVFFAEVIAFKLFNVTKLRGDYSTIPSSIREKRGEKNDTFLVIDEAQIVLPDVNSKDKESSAQIFNRIAAESRSKGFGLIIVSQSLSKFSNVININIPNKIIFKTLGSDIPLTKKVINLPSKDKVFDIINTSFGIGLYIDETQKKSIFISPWYDGGTQKKRI